MKVFCDIPRLAQALCPGSGLQLPSLQKRESSYHLLEVLPWSGGSGEHCRATAGIPKAWKVPAVTKPEVQQVVLLNFWYQLKVE